MVKRKRIDFFRILSVICWISCVVDAAEREPWLNTYFEFESQAKLRFQGYRKLNSGSARHKQIPYHSNDGFCTLSLGLAFPPGFAVEVAAEEAWTRRQKGRLDAVRATGRYAWLNQLEGDPISLVSGMTLIQAFPSSLRDPSSFHHGRAEAECFLSVGREVFKDEDWTERCWSMVGIGIADRGSPWCRLEAFYSWLARKSDHVDLFIKALGGFGSHSLHLHHFRGYGKIFHQSVDVGLAYTHSLEYVGSLRLEYTTRVFARNFPQSAHQLLVQVLYTFGP